jgi:deazaflavin-dependent oxidoreductase (nitroreductase family)
MADFSQISWIAEHIALYRSDPEKAHMWDSGAAGGTGTLPTLLLTTTGRKTGKLRSLPLIYGNVGESYAVVASKGGMPTHPVWFRNLEAKPECDLMVGAKAVSARARIVTGEERDATWKLMAEIYPSYLDYQQRTERAIPVILLDPV